MTMTLYKVRDKLTGKFWNGNYHRSSFGNEGKSWKSKEKCESTMAYFLNYRSRWNTNTNITHSLPEHWEIVEVELVEKEKATHDTQDFLKYILLKNEVAKVNPTMAWFVEKMRSKKVLDKIEFLFKLKPAEGLTYVDMDRIMEARSHMRQLGVKTRTFREGSGVFGMMDRQQALKARLVLDVEDVVDLGALRKKLGI